MIRICEVCGYTLQMNKEGTVRLCCRRATFFGLPNPRPDDSADIQQETTADNQTLSAIGRC
jgi:hypothetical protein